MEMIRAIRLDPKRTILDLRIGGVYTAKYQAGFLRLTDRIKSPSNAVLKEGELKAVRITKIRIPDSVDVDIMDTDFIIAEDNILTEHRIENVPEKYKPQTTAFSWKNTDLERMRPAFEKTASVIRSAIYTKQPIIVRHHYDADGYAGGICLDRAIRPLVQKEHGDLYWKYYTRNASKTPFYDYLDATKDMEYARAAASRFGQKLPLIVLIDIGSGEENEITLKMVKMLGGKVVVIDHHYPGESEGGKTKVCRQVSAHINPFLFGSDSRWTAGMLGYELARMVNKDAGYIDMIPGLSAIADKSDLYGMLLYSHYLEKSAEDGYDEEYLKKLVRVIDFEAQSVKFLEIPTIMDALYGHDREFQRQFVELIYPEIEEKTEKFKSVIAKYAVVKDMENFRLVWLDVEKCSISGEYPAPRNVVAIAHDMHKEDDKGTITVGKLYDMLIFRCDNVREFDVNKLLKGLMEDVPKCMASGGGHAAAGAIKYIQAAENDVEKYVRDYIKGLSS